MKKTCKFISLILILIVLLPLAGCSVGKKEYSKEAFMMGTIISLKYYGKDGEKAIEESVKRIDEIEKSMSLNIGDSEISQINKEAGIKPVIVSDSIFEVIERGIYYGELSKSRFDISIRPVDALWAIGTENERVPEKSEIDEALKKVDYRNIEINKEKKTIYLKEKGMAIDLGGIAKGYAADELVNILKKYKIDSAMINLGGNLYVYGSKDGKEVLNIGIQDPKKTQGEYFGVVKVKDKSVVTSGNYERYFEKDGKRYHHIMDPSTGYPSENGIISSTIISDKSIDGDALSTATYVIGVEKAMQLIESIGGVEAIIVTDDNKIYTSSGINESNFNITNKEYSHEAGR